jgi:hypothetical protein
MKLLIFSMQYLFGRSYLLKFIKCTILFGFLTFVLMQNIYFSQPPNSTYQIYKYSTPIYILLHIITWNLNICLHGGCIYGNITYALIYSIWTTKPRPTPLLNTMNCILLYKDNKCTSLFISAVVFMLRS